MLAGEVVVTIAGHAKPKGSLRCIGGRGRHQLIEDNAASSPWRKEVANHARRLLNTPDQRADPHQPIGVEITFTLDRPATHMRTGANAHRTRDGAPTRPVTRSSYDIDKLIRLILDALQDAKILPDDAAVCEVIARKFYILTTSAVPDSGDALPWPGVRIRIYPLQGTR